METNQVVVSRSGESVRTGALLDNSSGLLTVRWDDDGSQGRVRFSATTRFFVRGSIRHLAFADPAAVAERLERDPVGVFVQAIKESGRKLLKAAELKAELVSVPQEAVDRAWRRAQKKVGAAPGVVAKNSGYRWSARAEEASEPVERAEVVDEQRADDVPEAETSIDQADEPVHDEYALLLKGVLGLGDRGRLPELLLRPLDTGVSLGSAEGSAISALLAAAPAVDLPLLHGLLLARPARTDQVDQGALPPGVPVDSLFDSALVELRRHGDRLSVLRPSAVALLSRAFRLQALAEVRLPVLVELIGVLTRDPDVPPFEQLDDIAGLLARRVRSVSQAALSEVDLSTVARIAARLRFEPRRGRTALLVAVHERDPASVRGADWWRDVEVLALGECVDDLGPILADRDVVGQHVRPLVGRAVGAAPTRRRLFQVLALPAPLAEMISVDAIAAALRRVALSDPVLASWSSALQDRD